jgi:hypothetical protein
MTLLDFIVLRQQYFDALLLGPLIETQMVPWQQDRPRLCDPFADLSFGSWHKISSNSSSIGGPLPKCVESTVYAILASFADDRDIHIATTFVDDEWQSKNNSWPCLGIPWFASTSFCAIHQDVTSKKEEVRVT